MAVLRTLTKSEKRLAVQLLDYIRDRAVIESMEFMLTLNGFEEMVACDAGCFGVHHDGDRILWDEHRNLSPVIAGIGWLGRRPRSQGEE